jgi:hypothetical protein
MPMLPFAERIAPVSRRLLWACLAAQVLTLLLMGLHTLNGPLLAFHIGDILYYYKAALHVLMGQLPYRDFEMAYPPLALVYFLAPHAVGLGMPLPPYLYACVFLGQSITLAVGIGLLLVRMAAHGRANSPRAVLLFYTLLVLACAPLLPWRYDLFPIFLSVLALSCFGSQRPGWAGFWLGLGIAAKLYPVVLLPVFALAYLAARQRRALAALMLSCLGAASACFLPWVGVKPGVVFSFLTFHARRGLEIESLPAAALMLAHRLGLTDAGFVLNYGAVHLVSPLAPAIIHWLPLAYVLVGGAGYLCCRIRFRQECTETGQVSAGTVAWFCVIALLGFILANKVFSTQYIFWLLPFAPLLPRRQAALLGVSVGLTSLIYPWAWGGIMRMEMPALLLLNGRNALLLALWVWMLKEAPARLVSPDAALQE